MINLYIPPMDICNQRKNHYAELIKTWNYSKNTLRKGIYKVGKGFKVLNKSLLQKTFGWCIIELKCLKINIRY